MNIKKKTKKLSYIFVLFVLFVLFCFFGCRDSVSVKKRKRVVVDQASKAQRSENVPVTIVPPKIVVERYGDTKNTTIIQGGALAKVNNINNRRIFPNNIAVNPAPEQDFHTEDYSRIYENSFVHVSDDPHSTFSIDVDTASYSNIRRFLSTHSKVPKDAVRLEELINYFSYDYAKPQGENPFAVNMEIASCPWQLKHRLLRIGLKGRKIDNSKRPASNLVFLLDVSGSMSFWNKLPLLKKSLKMLVQNLNENDRVAIVVYAGAAGLVLPSTTCDKKQEIIDSLEQLYAGGSTNGAEGIELAYRTALNNYINGGTNRVILATDGDFNVGMTDRGSLVRFIEQKAKSNVFLTVLGFGMGNYKDATLEKLANRGNGNYAYIDNLQEARKVLVEQIGGTLVTIAKDVKIQVEFNPAKVSAYRLIGYENRLLNHQDFNDDKKDAGEIGAGHTVTAFYEVIPTNEKYQSKIDPLKYQQTRKRKEAANSNELLTLKLRYKFPHSNSSKLLQFPIVDSGKKLKNASKDFVFASSVACFGMLLRDSKYKSSMTYEFVLELAQESKGNTSKYRDEFIELVKTAKTIYQK